MIARIIILIMLAIVLPDLYFDRRRQRRNGKQLWWKRLVYWLPGLLMIGWAVQLAFERNFIPDDPTLLNWFLLLFGIIFIPKAIYALFTAVGRVWCRLRHSKKNWAKLIGLFIGAYCIGALIYGSTIGVRKLKVNRVDVYLSNLPASFEGYRIVHFSDAHVGTFSGSWKKILQRDVDSINAQQADAIVFTGDLINTQPSELYPVQEMLRSLNAKDGVFSVLGNHDYSEYTELDPAIEAANERELVSRERQFGWTLLLNERRSIRRGNDSIIIVGTENDGKRPSPTKADLAKAVKGVKDGACVIMLQHEPNAWRRSILPESTAQLTLSGHTHGGQISLFGLRVSRISCAEDYGLYEQDGRFLYVSCGIGGVLPIRLGVSPEIAVITLHQKK